MATSNRFAKGRVRCILSSMTKIDLCLTVDEQSALDVVAAEQGFASTEAYVQDLVRNDLEMRRFKALIQAGLDSPIAATADAQYFDGLRQRLLERSKARA